MKLEKNSAIILAAGEGSRLNMPLAKAFVTLDGITLLDRSIDVFKRCGLFSQIIVVLSPECLSWFKRDDCLVCVGGKSRSESFVNGYKYLTEQKKDFSCVAIHDAARCLVDVNLIKSCVDEATKFGAAIPALPVVDSLIKSATDSIVERYVDRLNFYQVQTPQVFRKDVIEDVFRKSTFDSTDEASVVLKHHQVKIIEGSRKNIKITYPDDLKIASLLLTL
jgi:2-C-methyl-D-erythritol 4-phosphate cytidylyltransferase